jgi:hypothetical protein
MQIKLRLAAFSAITSLFAVSSVYAATISDTVVCNTRVTVVPETPNEQAGFLAAFCPAPAGLPDALVNLTEGAAALVSDQIWTQAGFFYFVSDNDPSTLVPNAVPTGYPIKNFGNRIYNIPETGNLQDVSRYFGLPAGYISVRSDLDTTGSGAPEPATALLVLPALLLIGIRRRRTAKQEP